MLGKKSSEKSAKNVFYIHTNIVTKNWGEQNARNNFSSKTLIVRSKKCWEKNRRKKVRKIFFLYSHEYRDQKIGGTKRAELFLQKHTISASKKCLEKNRRKKVQKTFFIFTRIS